MKRRHVIYVPGYDTRGLKEYYNIFASEFPGFRSLYRLDARVSDYVAEPLVGRWSAATEGPGWRVDTTYDFLVWDDIARQTIERPLWRVIAEAWRTLARLVVTGALPRYFRSSWRFAALCVYPYVLFIVWIIAAALLALAAADALDRLGAAPLVSALAAAIVGGATLAALLKLTERPTYLLYLFSMFTFLDQLSHAKRPDCDARVDAFTAHLIDTVRTSQADEILLVGHSVGSCLAVDMMVRALARDPDLGRRGPRIAVLTIGAMLPTIGFYPAADWFRQEIRRLAVEPDIDWVEYQSRKDVISFFAFDPIDGHRLDLPAPRRNPVIVRVSFGNLIKAENYRRFRRRFFRVHFQFIMANEKFAAYDYFMIVCGPFPLSLRVAHPWDVTTAGIPFHPDRDAAWRRLGMEESAAAR